METNYHELIDLIHIPEINMELAAIPLNLGEDFKTCGMERLIKMFYRTSFSIWFIMLSRMAR